MAEKPPRLEGEDPDHSSLPAYVQTIITDRCTLDKDIWGCLVDRPDPHLDKPSLALQSIQHHF